MSEADPVPAEALDETNDYYIVTVAWLHDRPVYNLGRLDAYSACTILRHVIEAIEADLPRACAWDQLPIDSATEGDEAE